METTLRELVDLLPTQSLELYVQAYEAGEVGHYLSFSFPRPFSTSDRNRYCPRCCLGFGPPVGSLDKLVPSVAERLRPVAIPDGHPAWHIEEMARDDDLDPAALYSECVLAIAERDAATEPVREHCPA